MVDIPDDEDDLDSGALPMRKGSGDLHRDFLEGLARDFQEHGEAAVRKLRRMDPGKYLDLIAKVVPKEMLVRNVNSMRDTDLVEITRELLGEAAAETLAQKLGVSAGKIIDVTEDEDATD